MIEAGERRVAVVTGATRGIGAGLVAAFRKRGYAVVANARTIEPSADPDMLAVPGDIADPATPAALVEQAADRFGRVDTVVNNAGLFFVKPFLDYTSEDIDQLIGVNLLGPMRLAQHAARVMLDQGGGHIVNLTTTLAENADSRVPSALTSLTKGGITAATRSLAIEYAGRGIRVNAVSPGATRTSMHPAEAHEFLASLQPMGRMGDIADVVDAVLYLESASFVTGEVLHVDGGQVAGR